MSPNSHAPVLLTGAGKSQVDRRIFEMKLLRQRVSGKVVELTFAVIHGDQAALALFGHGIHRCGEKSRWAASNG